jgi:hypothetical protein
MGFCQKAFKKLKDVLKSITPRMHEIAKAAVNFVSDVNKVVIFLRPLAALSRSTVDDKILDAVSKNLPDISKVLGIALDVTDDFETAWEKIIKYLRNLPEQQRGKYLHDLSSLITKYSLDVKLPGVVIDTLTQAHYLNEKK